MDDGGSLAGGGVGGGVVCGEPAGARSGSAGAVSLGPDGAALGSEGAEFAITVVVGVDVGGGEGIGATGAAGCEGVVGAGFGDGGGECAGGAVGGSTGTRGFVVPFFGGLDLARLVAAVPCAEPLGWLWRIDGAGASMLARGTSVETTKTASVMVAAGGWTVCRLFAAGAWRRGRG